MPKGIPEITVKKLQKELLKKMLYKLPKELLNHSDRNSKDILKEVAFKIVEGIS